MVVQIPTPLGRFPVMAVLEAILLLLLLGLTRDSQPLRFKPGGDTPDVRPNTPDCSERLLRGRVTDVTMATDGASIRNNRQQQK